MLRPEVNAGANVTLQVIHFAEGAYASMLSSFALLNFPEIPGVVYIEGLTGDLYAAGGRCAALCDGVQRAEILSVVPHRLSCDHQKDPRRGVLKVGGTMLDQNWRKSTRSGGNGQCVEVRRVDDTIEVRDTKDRSGPALRFTLAEWTAFTGGAKGGEFDI